MTPSITRHRLWHELKIHLRQHGHRLELAKPRTHVVARQFRNLEVACAHCGSPIHPVRYGRGYYLAVTCELRHSLACARSEHARAETQRIRKEMVS